MADNSILTPGGSGNECINPVNEQIDTSQFLKVDYRLGSLRVSQINKLLELILELLALMMSMIRLQQI